MMGSTLAPGWFAALLLAVLGAGTAAADEAPKDAGLASAVFAGGCFWCMEPPFDALEGVVSTTSGFTGGHVEAPSYEQVVSGGTGHVEAVKVVYDPARVSFDALLDVYWRNVDPLDDGGQFCDRGEAYLTAIFVADDRERALAEASRDALDASGRFDRAIVTPVRTRSEFWPAEAYHQGYYRKNPLRYRFYRFNCGRDQRLNALWGD